MDKPFYPNLAGKIAERGIKKSIIARAISCSPRAFNNKMNGRTEFSWSEVCTIQRMFFPDIPKETLLERLN